MDPRLERDVHHLSTADLVLCWSLLYQMAESARRRNDRRMYDEFSARLSAISDELGSRQLRLDVDSEEAS